MTASHANFGSRGDPRSELDRRPGSELLRDLLFGLPALLAGLLVIVFVICLGTVHESSVLNFYVNEAQRLETSRNSAEALICYERLTQMRPEYNDYAYGKARVLEEVGRTEEAAALLRALAPRDRAGYLPAHLLLANRALIALNQNPKAREDIEPHLLHCLKLKPSNSTEIEVHALLGKFYVAEGRFAEAEPHLAKVFVQRPDVLMPLARTAAALNNLTYARARATEARDYFLNRLEEEGNADNIDIRIEAADAAFFLGEFSRAETILLAGLARSKESRLHAALSMVYVEWYKALEKDPKVKMEDRLALLESGLRHAPANPVLIDCFLAVLKAGGPQSERARAALRSTLADGKAPAVVHFALGMDDWERGQTDSAKIHLREAVTLAPELLVAANNLAMLLAFGAKADPKEALQIIDRVIERRPDVAEYRDTRGRILASLKRWEEALPDLELALKTYPTSTTIHAALADIYSHLGMADMAEEHKRRAAVEKSK